MPDVVPDPDPYLYIVPAAVPIELKKELIPASAAISPSAVKMSACMSPKLLYLFFIISKAFISF